MGMGGPSLMAAPGAGMYMQQGQPLHPDAGVYGAPAPPRVDHFGGGGPTVVGTPMDGAGSAPRSGPGSPGEQVQVFRNADPILRRLCDSTFVPTRDWPVDTAHDQHYVSAVVQQLQQFHGYTSISKLRSSLKSRLMSSDNIKSVPLKAMLAAYPKFFVVKGNQVSLSVGPKY